MTQQEALTILKTGANVFLTGEPGSGKTHTIREYISYLRDHGIEPAICASTGIAATHLHGMTIHSWSGIGARDRVTRYDIEQIKERERVVKRIRKTKVLIIDEISMLSEEMLDGVDAVTTSVRENPMPFGGLQVVFVGDFFQLPPIARGRDGETQFAFSSKAWEKANPIVCYLTEQHRHTDSELSTLLSEIRKGTGNTTIFDILETRTFKPEKNTIPKLYTHNADVDKINDDSLALLPATAKLYSMVTKGAAPLIEVLKKGCLSPEKLSLKIGASVMFTKNSIEDGFVNGTLGTVDSFAKDGMPVIRTINNKTIAPRAMEWTFEEDGKVKAKISQIPLRLAWAITVHKSQGMSMDAAYIDLSKAFEYGQGYVALSRVRTLSGLYLGGYNERALEVHPLVRDTDTTLKIESDEAQKLFTSMEKDELTRLHVRTIVSMGGVTDGSAKKFAKKEQKSTAAQTLDLLRENMSLDAIAKKRGLKRRTLIGHLETLHEQGDLTTTDRQYLRDYINPKTRLAIIRAFEKHGVERLTPVHEALKGTVDFEELAIARVALTDDEERG